MSRQIAIKKAAAEKARKPQARPSRERERKARQIPVCVDEPSTSAASTSQVGCSDLAASSALQAFGLPQRFLRLLDIGSSQDASPFALPTSSRADSPVPGGDGFISMCRQSADIMLQPLTDSEVTDMTARSTAHDQRPLIPQLLTKRLSQMAGVVPALRERPSDMRSRLLGQSASLGYAILAVWKLDSDRQNLVANMASGDTLLIYSTSDFRSLCDAMSLSYDSILSSNQRFGQGLLSNFPNQQTANIVRAALALTYIFSPHHITSDTDLMSPALPPPRRRALPTRGHQVTPLSTDHMRILLNVHSNYMRSLTQYVQSISSEGTTQCMMRMIFCYEALSDLQLLEGFGALQARDCPRNIRMVLSRLPIAYVQAKELEDLDSSSEDLVSQSDASHNSESEPSEPRSDAKDRQRPSSSKKMAQPKAKKCKRS